MDAPEYAQKLAKAAYSRLRRDEFETLEWKNIYLQAALGVPVEVRSVDVDLGRTFGEGQCLAELRRPAIYFIVQRNEVPQAKYHR